MKHLGLPALPAHLRGTPAAPPEPYVEADADRAARRALAHEHRRARFLRRLPSRYSQASLASLSADQNPRGLTAGWLDQEASLTLLLHSPDPGLGKTYAAYAVGRAALDRGLWVEVWHLPDFLGALRPSGPDDPETTLTDATGCDLLILDDLGRESLTDWGHEQIHTVINARLNHERRTVLTTNLGGEEMAQRYGYPLLDRITDSATIARITGESRRKPAAW